MEVLQAGCWGGLPNLDCDSRFGEVPANLEDLSTMADCVRTLKCWL